jgi:hypothetical protein
VFLVGHPPLGHSLRSGKANHDLWELRVLWKCALTTYYRTHCCLRQSLLGNDFSNVDSLLPVDCLIAPQSRNSWSSFPGRVWPPLAFDSELVFLRNPAQSIAAGPRQQNRSLKSKLCFDRRSVGQSVLVSSTHLLPTTRFLLLSVAGLLMWGAFPGEGTGLSFIIAAGSRQRSRSWIRVPRDSWPHLLSQIRDSSHLEGQAPVFISTRNRMAQLYPQALGSLFVAFYDSQGYGGGNWTYLHADDNCSSE